MMSSETNSNPTSPVLDGRPRRASTFSSVKNVSVGVAHTTRKAAESVGHATVEVLNSNVPTGAWAAAAGATSKAPTLGEIRNGAYADTGWQENERRRSIPQVVAEDEGPRAASVESGRVRTSFGIASAGAAVNYDAQRQAVQPLLTPIAHRGQKKSSLEEEHEEYITIEQTPPTGSKGAHSDIRLIPDKTQRAYSSGYVPPPKLPWTTTMQIGLRAFWKWFLTPFGFLVTLYSLNVVAWGGMLFLLLCNASPAMCWVSDGNGGWVQKCNALASPRRKWLEIDSQILNALFCVTGFGLIPWRFRDLYYLLRWRLCSAKRYGLDQKIYGLRTLAGIHRGWFRLPGHDTLDEIPALQYRSTIKADATLTNNNGIEAGVDDLRMTVPLAKSPDAPLTGIRAPPTALWKLDFFVWCQVGNTFLQGCLCGVMWGFNRFTRPSWCTGLFIALACMIVGIAGIMSHIEGKRIKRVEGIQPSPAVEAEILKMKEKEALELTVTRGSPHAS